MAIRELAKVLVIVFGLLAIAGLTQYARGATTLLPNGEQCFQTGAGPVVSGSVNMYSVGTTTPKTTWTNSTQSATNTNPIQLDANGCAIIYGVGSYRQQLWSGPVVGGVATGNLIYDLTTTDTSASNSTFWAGTSAGTPNAITVVDTGFNNTDGSVINFLASNTNTAATTLSVSGGGAINIEQSTTSGPAALTAGCIVTNNPVSVVYSSSAAAFLLLTSCPASSATSAAIAPGGYLSLTNDANNVVQGNFDEIGLTTVFYSPYVSNQIPIWNGAAYAIFTFTPLSLALTNSAHLSSTIYDVFAYSNAGLPTLVTGPAWTTSTFGTGSRGAGAGTTQISRTNGLWTNTVAISGTNGATVVTVPANQATYLGSILIDPTPGQVSTIVNIAANARWGVWNAYNRKPITVRITDPTVGGWTYNTATFRPSNNNPNNNSEVIFTGLAEESALISQVQNVGTAAASATIAQIGIGLNSTTSPAVQFQLGQVAAVATTTIGGALVLPQQLGANRIYSLESGSGTGTTQFYGTQLFMNLESRWNG